MAVSRARIGGMRSGRVIVVALAVVACASILAACDSGNDSTTTIPAVTPSTAPYTNKKMRVDLQVTGADNFTISGVVGRCQFSAAGIPPAYIITNVPQLGPAGSIIVWGPTPVPGTGTVPANVKALINGAGLLSPNDGVGVRVRPDLQSIDLNTDVSGFTQGGTANGVPFAAGLRRDRITGSIRCI